MTIKLKHLISPSEKGYYQNLIRIKAERTKNARESLKTIVYDHYGNKCMCCGESNRYFLSIDHKNNDGSKDERIKVVGRKNPTKRMIGSNWYRKIIDLNFPNDLQLLCYNCNFGKVRNYGICPHKHILNRFEETNDERKNNS